MTDEEMALYRRRKLEIHEEVARDGQLYGVLNLFRAKAVCDALRRLKDRK